MGAPRISIERHCGGLAARFPEAVPRELQKGQLTRCSRWVLRRVVTSQHIYLSAIKDLCQGKLGNLSAPPPPSGYRPQKTGAGASALGAAIACIEQLSRHSASVPLTPFLREMEVVAVQSAQLGVLQRKRVRACRDDHILTNLARMGENARKAVKVTLAELHYIVPSPDRVEVPDDVIAEVCRKCERVRAAVADEEVVACGAGQLVAPARSEDRLTRTFGDDVPRAVDFLRRILMHRVRKAQFRGVSPRSVRACGYRT